MYHIRGSENTCSKQKRQTNRKVDGRGRGRIYTYECPDKQEEFDRPPLPTTGGTSISTCSRQVLHTLTRLINFISLTLLIPTDILAFAYACCQLVRPNRLSLDISFSQSFFPVIRDVVYPTVNRQRTLGHIRMRNWKERRERRNRNVRARVRAIVYDTIVRASFLEREREIGRE